MKPLGGRLELTSTERWFVLGVVVLFLLGLGTKHFVERQAGRALSDAPAPPPVGP